MDFSDRGHLTQKDPADSLGPFFPKNPTENLKKNQFHHRRVHIGGVSSGVRKWFDTHPYYRWEGKTGFEMTTVCLNNHLQQIVTSLNNE